MTKFLSTLFLGVIAAMVGTYLQHRSWKNRSIEDAKQREFNDSLEIVDTLGRAVSKRLTAQRHFLSLLNDASVSESDIEAYRNSVFDWMNEFTPFKSKVLHYFGKDESLKFENQIHSQLREASDILMRTYKLGYENLSTNDKKEHDSVGASINVAQYTAAKFINLLNEKISNGEIGKTARTNNVESGDLGMISKTYLIQRLFALKS